MSGGGGTSGKVEFPQHMEEIHKDWLAYSGSPTAVNTDLIQVMNNALGVGGNPYESLSYSDPAGDFDQIETQIDEWETMADGIDEETDFSNIIDQAMTKNNTLLATAVEQAVNQISDSSVMKAVKAYEAKASYSRTQAMRRFSGQMSDINAVQSSSFMMGMALIESQHLQSVNEYHAKVAIDLVKTYVSQYMQSALRSARLMTQMLDRKVAYQKAIAEVMTEETRLRTVAEAEHVGNKADLAAKFAKWDFRVFEYGAQVLGSMGGGTRMPEKPSKAKSAIGGAMSGASAGAALGPGGAAAGAVLGGVAGLL